MTSLFDILFLACQEQDVHQFGVLRRTLHVRQREGGGQLRDMFLFHLLSYKIAFHH